MDDSRTRIKILPDNLVDVIAAGEVVERPASVVKELIENSVDAGAKKVQVYLEDGGRRKIRVVDDGVGMDEDDCLMAIERHATSKVASLEDLSHIRTLGFRGEALPSIASAGKFTLESWDGSSESGTRVVVDSGKLLSVEPVGRARGTTVTLERIFGKLPARRKFLRTRETETAWCLTVVEDAAFAQTAVSFSVVSDGATVLDLPPSGSLLDRAASLWGAEEARRLVPLSGSVEGVSLDGLVSPPTVTFSRRTRHKVILNGRPVRDPLINRVISSGLAGSWPSGRFPALVLVLEMEDDLVDVNVHPAKREVRLRRTDHLAEALRRAVSGLKSGTPAYAGRGTGEAGGLTGGEEGAPGNDAGGGPSEDTAPAQAAVARDEGLPFGPRISHPGPGEMGDQQKAPVRTPQGRLLGQVMGTFILLEDEEGLQILDQHAAHERIVFNRLMAARAGEGAPVQRLAVPLVLTLSPSEAANLGASAGILGSFGFEIGEFGPATVRVTSVPADLDGSLIEELLRAVASDPDSLGREAEEVALAVSRWACRLSVMAGQKLSPEQILALLKDLEEAERGFSCPHGRPTRVTLAPADIERLFGRR